MRYISRAFEAIIFIIFQLSLQMTSVERIKQYTKLDPEEDTNKKYRPIPENWPLNGGIELKNVSFSYDKSLPDVLKSLTVNILPGEKVRM